MIHTFIVVATWLVGAFGVVGAVVAIAATVYLGPAATQAILAPLFKRFVGCTRCVVVAVILLVALTSYWLGHHQAAAECRADELNSRIAAQQADLDAANKAKADENARANKVESDANDQHQKDTDFIARLRANPACGFDPDAGNGVRGPHAAGAKPAARASAAAPPAVASASRFHLPLSLVQGGRMSGKRSERDAPSDSK
ncbi:hypothetical protein IVA94_14930 [Bradyrhizobium sp. 156]|uniref:hypothetical protein n=1 Tax=Bradyrhizobium sp. 156 TaxID=2782630 RepID=UPI001FFAF4C8|nr:hypothetical protein [Bradyrhizobium sp. 156]MCK1322163.1 hypothetical protein [Bradyrhizobium sp. 156]